MNLSISENNESSKGTQDNSTTIINKKNITVAVLVTVLTIALGITIVLSVFLGLLFKNKYR